MRLAHLFIGALLLGGCDVGVPADDHASRSFDRPPVQLVAISATASYDGEGQPVHQPLLEGQITDGVALSASFRLFFDRFLLPAAVIRQAVCLRPSSAPVASAQDCIEPAQAFTEPEYDPVLRSVIYRLPPGQRLVPDTVYRFTLLSVVEPGQPGVVAFDGATLEHSHGFEFRTQAATSPTQDELGPSPDRYCDSIRCFGACSSEQTSCVEACMDDDACEDACEEEGAACDALCVPLCVLPKPVCEVTRGSYHFNPRLGMFATCASTGCHSHPSGNFEALTDFPLAMGLDLSTEPAVADTAIGKTAHQTQQGQESRLADRSPLRFGRAMPRIDPGHPGNSYLLYKLIVNPLNHPHSAGVLEPGLSAAIARLRSTVVVGLPMPRDVTGMVRGLSDPRELDPDEEDEDPGEEDEDPGVDSFEQLQLISSWIAHGAVLRCP